MDRHSLLKDVAGIRVGPTADEEERGYGKFAWWEAEVLDVALEFVRRAGMTR
jgi:hypothetical protein